MLYAGNSVKERGVDAISIHQLIADIWREVCRHIEIGEAAQTIGDLLAGRGAVGQIFVRRINLQDKTTLETVACGPGPCEQLLSDARTVCSPSMAEELLDWCRDGKAIRRSQHAAGTPLIETIVPRTVGEEVVVGPLVDANGPCGILGLVAAEGQSLGEEGTELAQALLEPFSVALENDHRVREMEAMRAAAEAEK